MVLGIGAILWWGSRTLPNRLRLKSSDTGICAAPHSQRLAARAQWARRTYEVVPGGTPNPTGSRRSSAMKTNTKISFGIAALVAAGTFGFVPASADKGDQVASVSVTLVAAVLASPETPQDAVWDMTYGAER